MTYEHVHSRQGVEDIIRDAITPTDVKPPYEVCRAMFEQARSIAESGKNSLHPRQGRIALMAEMLADAKRRYAVGDNA